MVATIASGLAQVPIRPRDCDHRELAYLGVGGTVSYYRCRTCGAAVIQERNRRWVLRLNSG